MSTHEKQFDLLVFIGRFQPFHKGHLEVIQKAMKESHKVLVLVGSSDAPRSTRNPFTFAERAEMITQSLQKHEHENVAVAALRDAMYNDELWVKNIQSITHRMATRLFKLPKDARIGIVGHSKDNTSYYLSLFPQWGSVDVENHQNLNSTPLREAYFADSTWIQQEAALVLPLPVREYLQKFIEKEYYSLVEEYAFVDRYQEQWSSAPYPVCHVTVDAVVVQSGHILLVKRGAHPGKGLMALPGGFLDLPKGETLIEGCIRELREETQLKVPGKVLVGNIRDSQVFDDPHRSSRGRTITHAFYIELPPQHELPTVKGSDDAEEEGTGWVPLSEVSIDNMFEDHYFIIQKMVGVLN